MSAAGDLAQGVRVQNVSGDGDGLTLQPARPPRRRIRREPKQCVLATGIPILDRGGFFARLKPSRSYCMAYKVPGNITRGCIISTDSPTRSVRYAPTAGRRSAHRRRRGASRGPGEEPGLLGADLDAWTKRALPRSDADALLVGAGLHARRRAALRRAHPPRQRQDLRGNGFRQVGHDKRHRRRPGAVEPHPRRSDGLGQRVRQLEPARTVGLSQRRCRPISRWGSTWPRAGSRR